MLFRTTVLKYLWRHPWIAVFNIFSIALGVGVYLAIQIANHSANRAFHASMDVVSGRSHLVVESADGEIDETLLPKLAQVPGVIAASPVLEGYATVPAHPGEYLHLLGIDVFTSAEFVVADPVNFENSGGSGQDRWLSKPGMIAVSRFWAQGLGTTLGDTLDLQVDGTSVRVTIGWFLPEENNNPGNSGAEIGESVSGLSSRIAMMDIGWMQELFHRQGKVSSIQIRLEDPPRWESVAAAMKETVLPPDVVAAPPSQRSAQVQSMLEGFQLNLTAMSLVSILVGVYLIYNTVAASVVRRRKEIGILRANGATRGQVKRLFFAEALVLGLLGVALGLLAGPWLAGFLLEGVSQTISTHYIMLSIEERFLSGWHVASAVAYGLAATLIGAWLPAREAAQVDPVNALHPGRLFERARMRCAGLFLAGVAVLLLSGWAAWQSLVTGPAPLSFLSCFLLIAGFSLMVPAVCRVLAALVLQLTRPLSVVLRLGAENLDRSLHRVSVTAAALMAALAMMSGVSIMISSFRATIDAWIDKAIVADIFIAPAANEVLGRNAFLPREVMDFVKGQDGVLAVDSYRETRVSLSDGSRYTLGVVDGINRKNLSFTGGHDEEKMARFFEAGTIIVSESFARKFGAEDGDSLDIPTPRGNRKFTIAGVFYDYSDDNGLLSITRPNFERYWNDERIHSVGVFLEENANMARLEEAVRKEFSGRGEFAIYSNRALRGRVFEVFDQTFAVTYVLRTIAVAVAAIGIVLTLTTLVAERRREIGVLRSIGSSRGQVQAVYLTEAGLIGLFSSILGIVCGVALAAVLTLVVNKAFFGWTIQFQIPWAELAWTPLWVTGIALLAGITPAFRAGRVPIAEAVRTE